MIYSASNIDLDPDEIRCDSNQLGLLIPHLREHPDIRININLVEKDSIERLEHELSLLSAITDNYTIAVAQFSVLKELLKKDIPAYFNFPITDWETFSALIDWGVSDILIDGPLGFSMPEINEKKGSTLVRVRPQESPNAGICLGDNENTFFIRPEDLDKYDPYIDVCEIYCRDRGTEEVVFNIYKRKSYLFDLSLLVKQLKVKVPNPHIHPDFVKHRINCGQACKTGKSNCKMCANTLYLTNLIVDYFNSTRKTDIE